MKLRLLLTDKCNRKCKGCCNNGWNLDSLPIEKDYTGYHEILITGGEPMLIPNLVIKVAQKIRSVTDTKIYMYTAEINNIFDTLAVLYFIDGITLTLHTQKDVIPFLRFNNMLLINDPPKHKSFRLNIFDDVSLGYTNLDFWKVKSNMKWIKDCPLPKDEVFHKYGE